MIATVRTAQLALRNDNADGQAVTDIVEISVDPGHHPVALTLQSLGGGRNGVPGGQHTPVGHNGRHVLIGRIGNEIFRPQVRIGRAPEHIGGKLRLIVEQRVLGGQVVTQGFRGLGTQADPAQEGRGKQQRYGFAKKWFHESPPSQDTSSLHNNVS